MKQADQNIQKVMRLARQVQELIRGRSSSPPGPGSWDIYHHADMVASWELQRLIERLMSVPGWSGIYDVVTSRSADIAFKLLYDSDRIKAYSILFDRDTDYDHFSINLDGDSEEEAAESPEESTVGAETSD